MRTLLTVLLCVGLAAVEDGSWLLRLDGALPWHQVRDRRLFGIDGKDSTALSAVELELVRRDGRWQAAWLQHPIKIAQWSPVAVLAASEQVGRWNLRLAVELPPIISPPGGLTGGGRLELELLLEPAAGTLTGTFSGAAVDGWDEAMHRELTLAFDLDQDGTHSLDQKLTARIASVTVAGTLRGQRRPLPVRVAEPLALDTSRHPHLFFTGEDLPALCRRAGTAAGEAILERLAELQRNADENGFGFRNWEGQADHSMQSSWAVGLGLLYQLTGEQRYADQARDYVWSGMYASLPNLNQWRQSHRIIGTAIAYDLCHDGWDEAFRANVYHYLLGHALEFARRLDLRDPLNHGERFTYGGQTTSFPRDMAHVDSRRYLCAAALAALAIMGDEPPIYRPAAISQARHIPPEAGFEPFPGVPVVELQGGLMFPSWLVNGPFAHNGEDPLAAIGGLARARPIPGTVVQRYGVDLDFRRYHPCSEGDRRRGPHIYPRNCGRFWTSSTGNGYWPGRKVAAMAEERGEHGTDIVLYTVWRNDEAQHVQAFPNAYWQSRGGRMWLAGQEVVDEQIVQVDPGWYPVTVHLPITGGYSTQGPHLGWYSHERFAEEQQRHEACRAMFAIEGGLPAALARAMARDLRHFLLTQVDATGWNAADFPEHLYPFLQAWRHVMGEDLAADTGATRVVPIACGGRELYQHYSAALALSQAFPFLSERDRQVARWYRARYDTPFRRPVDYLLPFIEAELEGDQLAPGEAYPLATTYPDRALTVFNRTWERGGEDDAAAVLVDAGGRLADVASAPSVQITGIRRGKYGRGWLRSAGAGLLGAIDSGSGPWVEGYWNTSRPRQLAGDLAEDGSGVVSWEVGPLRRGEIRSDGRRRVALGEPVPGTAILRSVRVDYDGTAGAPVVVVIADRFRGFADTVGKHVQFWSDVRLDRIERPPGGDVFRLTEADPERRGKLHSLAQVSWLAPRPLELGKTAQNKEGTMGMIHAVLDRRRQGAERAEQRLTEGFDEVGGGELTDLLDDLMLADDVAPPPQAAAGDALGEDDTLVFTVVTVGRSEAPAVQRIDEASLSVGGVRYRFDGRQLRRAVAGP